jgi:hypothetical protein
MRNAVAVLGAVLAVGCASGGSGVATPVSNPAPHVDVGGSTMTYSVSPDVKVSPSRDIPAPVAKSWATLPTVFSKLGLSVTAYDSTTHTIMGERLRSRANFGTHQLRSLMDCGDIAGTPAIDRYEVSIRVRTVVDRAGEMSAVRTVVDATARPSAVAGTPVQCQVNDGIADEIASTLAAMVQAE